MNGVKKHFIRRIIEVDGVCRDEEIDDVEVSTIEIFNTIHEHTIQPVLEKCRKLVGKFKHSESLQRKLSEKQLSTNQEFKVNFITFITFD